MDDMTTKVLLLDDDPNLRRVLGDILNVKGFESIPVDTGESALAILEKQDIDVVLIDIKLDGISGLDVLRSIKRRFPAIECIMLAGHASQTTAIDAVNLGAYSFFQKPYEVDQLLIAMRRAAEKHAAEIALHEREARFRSLIENSSDLICILNPDASLSYISPSLERLLGYPLDDVVIGASLQEYIHPNDLGAFLEATQQLVLSPMPSPISLQFRIRHKNASWLTMEGTASNQISDPAIKGIIVNAHDITDRTRAESEIHRMLDRWSIVYRAGEAISASLDTEQVFLAVYRAVDQVMPCEDFVISLYDQSRNEIGGSYIIEKGKRVKPRLYKADNGLEGHIIHSGQSLVLNSREEIKKSRIKFVTYGSGPKIASVLAVPLQLKGKTIGMVSPQSYQSNSYSVEDRELLEMLASFAAVAIDNARLFEQAQQEIVERKQAEEELVHARNETAHANRLLLALNQAAQAVQRAHKTDEVYHAIQNQISDLGYFTTGFEITGEHQDLHISYITFNKDLIRKAEKVSGLTLKNFKFRPRANTIYYQAIIKGETVFIADAAQAVADTLPGKFRPIVRSITNLFKLNQSIYTPLKIGDETIGILAVTGSDLTAIDCPAIAAFANQAAIALQNARLYEQAQEEITERTQAENALAVSEAELRALFSSMQDMVLVIDRAGKYLKVAPTSPSSLVIPLNGLLGKTLRDLYPPKQAETLKRVVQKVLRTKQTSRIEYDLTLDSRTIWFETSISPLTHDSTIWVARDITSRKQAEAALVNSQQSYQKLVEQIPGVIYQDALDINASTRFISPQIKDLTGYEPAEWMADPDLWPKLLHPDDRAWVLAENQNHIVSGEPFRSDYRLIARNGHIVWVRDEAIGIRDPSGQLLYDQGVFTDITERKLAEDALRESETTLQAVLQSTADGILAVGQDNEVLYANERFAEIWRIPKDLLDKKDDSILLTHVLDQLSDPQIFIEKVQELYKSKKESFDTLNFKDGRVFERLSRPLLHGSKVRGRVWSFRDITARKKAEDQVRLSEEQYRMLAENMSDTVWLMDMSLVVTYASPSVTRLRGFSVDELNKIPLDRQMPPDSLHRALHLFSEILSPENLAQSEQPISWDIELEYYKKNGTRFWSENTFTLIRDPNGKPIAILGSGRDISERKAAKEALQNSEKYFRALIENNTDAVVLVDPRGVILYESPAYARMMGSYSSHRLGKSAFEFVHSDDKSFLARILNDLVQNPGMIRQITFRNQHKDGSWRWIEATATNMLGESAVQGLVINMHDITERRQAEEEIHRRVADLEVLYENGLSVSVLLDPKEIARKMLEILSKKLDWHHAAIRLINSKTSRVELIAINKPDLTPAETQTEIDRLNQIFDSPYQGLSGWVITHGKTFRSGNVTGVDRYIPAFPEIRSGLYVPLMIGDRVLGSIIVESRQVDRFSAEDEHLLQTLATQSAIAFENARLFQEAVSAAKRKDALHQGGLEIVRAGQSIEALCLAIHRAAQQVMPAEAFIVSLVTEDGREVEAPYMYDQGIRHPNTRLPKNVGITGRVIKSRRSLRLKDVQKTKGGKPIMLDRAEPTRAILSVPLLVQDKIVGVISAQSREADVYTADDQIFMETLASEAANAFENARLYQDVVSAAERRAVLFRAGQEIAAAGLDLEQVYHSIHQAIIQLMPLDVFTIILADENQRAFHAVYMYDRGERFPPFDPEWGLGLPGYIIREKKSLRISDSLKEKPIQTVKLGKPGSPRSIIALPLNSGAKIVGVISIQDYRPNIYGGGRNPLKNLGSICWYCYRKFPAFRRNPPSTCRT